MTRRGRANVALPGSETAFIEAIKRIAPPDRTAAEAAASKFLSIAMPLHGLGVLEEDLIRIAGIQGTAALRLKPRKLFVFCADNGVVKQGVTQTGQEVTAAVCEHLAYGGSTVNRMAALADCAVVPVDVGIAGEPRGEEILRRKVRSGTRDFTEEAAMTREECLQALFIGMELAAEEKRRGTALLLAGEMGIGNTTTSAALTAALLERNPAELIGRGAGLSDEGLVRKRRAVEKGLTLHKDLRGDALGLLSALGGFDLAALAGLMLGAALEQIPLLLDGIITEAAALAAVSLASGVRDYLFASHCSADPLAGALLTALDLKPLISAGLHLGEGTGAVAALPLLDMAEAVYSGADSFTELGIAAYTEQGGKS